MHDRAANRAKAARGARTTRARTGNGGVTRRRIGDCRGVGQAVLLEAEVGEEDDDMAARGVGPWRRRTTARSGRARGSVRRREVGGAQERWARGRGPAMADDGARGEELERGRRRAVRQRRSGGVSSCGGGRRRSGTTMAASRRR